jgi:hypothetical protein
LTQCTRNDEIAIVKPLVSMWLMKCSPFVKLGKTMRK